MDFRLFYVVKYCSLKIVFEYVEEKVIFIYDDY